MSGKVRLKVAVTVTCIDVPVARAMGDIIASKVEAAIYGATDRSVEKGSFLIEWELEPL